MLEPYIAEYKEKGLITLKIKVHAGAKQTRVKTILSDGTIKIDIAKIPEAGKANEMLIELLSEQFSVSKNKIEILIGKFSSDKTVKIS